MNAHAEPELLGGLVDTTTLDPVRWAMETARVAFVRPGADIEGREGSHYARIPFPSMPSELFRPSDESAAIRAWGEHRAWADTISARNASSLEQLWWALRVLRALGVPTEPQSMAIDTLCTALARWGLPATGDAVPRDEREAAVVALEVTKHRPKPPSWLREVLEKRFGKRGLW